MMVLLILCFACRDGDHSGHQETLQAVPEGMIGGTRCPCKGDCAGNRDPEMEMLRAMFSSLPARSDNESEKP